jgi:hypothetical protein
MFFEVAGLYSEHFPRPLRGDITDNGYYIVLFEPFQFVDGDTSILVPAGFRSNWNSVPRALWSFFPPWEYPEAGIVHDFLYRYGGVKRSRADSIHRRIMEIGGASFLKRTASYLALRVWGGITWDRYRANDGA